MRQEKRVFDQLVDWDADPDLAAAHETINRLKRQRACMVEHMAGLRQRIDELEERTKELEGFIKARL